MATAVTTAWAGAKTYQFESQTQKVVSGTRSSSADYKTVGQIDMTATALHKMITGDTGAGTQVQSESYMSGGYTYNKPGVGTSWFKFRTPAGNFAQENAVGGQVDLLKGASKVELMGTETVNNVKCQVISVTPNPDKLIAMAGIVQPEPQPGVTPPEISVKNVSVSICVTLDTNLPVKNEVHATIVEETVTTKLDVVTTVNGINDAVNIQLPADTANAIELPMPPA